MELGEPDIYDDVKQYLGYMEDDDPLAWYAYMALRTKYSFSEWRAGGR